MHRLVAVLICAAMTVAALAAPAPASAPMPPDDPGERRLVDPLHDCEGVAGVGEPVPEHVGVSEVTDSGKTINLDVAVVMDVAEGASIAKEKDPAVRAARLDDLRAGIRKRLVLARRSYAPLDINVRFTSFRLLAPLDPDGTPRKRTKRASAIIALTKQVLDGRRPVNADVVYTATDLDIWEGSIDGRMDVAGLADCIGGVRYATRAFAVGELSGAENVPVGPLTFYRHAAAKLMSHEVGHLLGAHHHYQDCATGLAEGYDDDDYVTPCTLMTNYLEVMSFNFSALEGAVVRGHAARAADDKDEVERGATVSSGR